MDVIVLVKVRKSLENLKRKRNFEILKTKSQENKSHTWRPMHFTWASVKGFGILSSIEAKSCSQYSMTRKTLRQIKRESRYSCLWNLLIMFYLSRLLPTTTSLMATIFSCWQFNSKVISRMALSGSPSFSLSIRIFFNATTSPFRVSLALSKN